MTKSNCYLVSVRVTLPGMAIEKAFGKDSIHKIKQDAKRPEINPIGVIYGPLLEGTEKILSNNRTM